MHKLITHIAWTRHGVNKFTDEVNQNFSDGWNVSEVKIEKKGLRFVCYALLYKK